MEGSTTGISVKLGT
ncbi:unnamed protein product, partial [Rotaria magnacalcarata]